FGVLQVEKMLYRSKCCFNGAIFDATFMPQLEPIPPRLLAYFVDNVEVLSHASLQLNQTLNLAVTGISPSRREGGRGLIQNIPRQRIQTISCQGRLYRYILPGNHATAPAKYVM